MTEEFATLVYIDLKRSENRWPLKRPQRWSWVALSGDNFRVLARSSESYTNKGDCLDAVALLFGDGTNVFLRQSEKGNVALRRRA